MSKSPGLSAPIVMLILVSGGALLLAAIVGGNQTIGPFKFPLLESYTRVLLAGLGLSLLILGICILLQKPISLMSVSVLIVISLALSFWVRHHVNGPPPPPIDHLEWMVCDANGLRWDDAKNCCTGEWRLPTKLELQAFFEHAKESNRIHPGERGVIIEYDGRSLALDNGTIWTNTAEGTRPPLSNNRYRIVFNYWEYPTSNPLGADHKDQLRGVLCVRRKLNIEQ